MVKIEFVSGHKDSQPQISEGNGDSLREEEGCYTRDIWKSLCVTLAGMTVPYKHTSMLHVSCGLSVMKNMGLCPIHTAETSYRTVHIIGAENFSDKC